MIMKEMTWEETSCLKQDINSILLDIGIPANLKGFDYLQRAIFVAILYPESRYQFVKMIYSEVADQCNTTISRCERAMRAAIEQTWARNDNHFAQKKYFGNSINKERGRPTISEFVCAVARHIESHQEHAL